ncbi:MAG: hypothetical protein RI885_2279 [Actinomycetota bacterium]
MNCSKCGKPGHNALTCGREKGPKVRVLKPGVSGADLRRELEEAAAVDTGPPRSTRGRRAVAARLQTSAPAVQEIELVLRLRVVIEVERTP